METVVVSVRLEERLVRALDAAGRERSEVIREALEEWLRRRKVTAMVREHETKYRAKPMQPGEVDWLLDAAVWPDEDGTMTPVVPRPSRSKTKRKKGRHG